MDDLVIINWFLITTPLPVEGWRGYAEIACELSNHVIITTLYRIVYSFVHFQNDITIFIHMQ